MDNEGYLVRAMLSAVRGRLGAAPLLASLAAGLARYHPSLVGSTEDPMKNHSAWTPVSRASLRESCSCHVWAAHGRGLVLHGWPCVSACCDTT